MLVGTQERARDLTGVGYLYKGLRADSPETEAETEVHHGVSSWASITDVPAGEQRDSGVGERRGPSGPFLSFPPGPTSLTAA